jgi:hypothetical protein
MLLAIYNKPRLAFDEVCQAIGVNKQTGDNLRSQRRVPIPMIGTPLTADVRDVAEHLDRLREQAGGPSTELK